MNNRFQAAHDTWTKEKQQAVLGPGTDDKTRELMLSNMQVRQTGAHAGARRQAQYMLWGCGAKMCLDGHLCAVHAVADVLRSVYLT